MYPSVCSKPPRAVDFGTQPAPDPQSACCEFPYPGHHGRACCLRCNCCYRWWRPLSSARPGPVEERAYTDAIRPYVVPSSTPDHAHHLLLLCWHASTPSPRPRAHAGAPFTIHRATVVLVSLPTMRPSAGAHIVLRMSRIPPCSFCRGDLCRSQQAPSPLRSCFRRNCRCQAG